MMEPDVKSALDFLELVFDAATDGGYVSLFSVDKGTGQRRTAWAPVEDLSQLAQPIYEFGLRGDVWFGCALRREPLPYGQRGGIADCLSIPGLWLDLDVGGQGHRLEGLFESYDEARTFIKRFAPEPHIVVRSGYGFQIWWLTPEMLPVEEAVNHLAHWRATWLKYGADVGIHIDDVWDIPRVMRLPGTLNRKGEAPVMATYRAASFPFARSR